MIKAGNIVIVKMKFIGIITAAKIPNDLIGISFEKLEARKANAVVDDVTSIAFDALLQVYAIHEFKSSFLMSLSQPDCFQASVKTKTSSAAIPRTTNTARFCKKP
jgi:hypothetical protein